MWRCRTAASGVPVRQFRFEIQVSGRELDVDEMRGVEIVKLVLDGVGTALVGVHFDQDICLAYRRLKLDVL